MKPYVLFQNLLQTIEDQLLLPPNINELSSKFSISLVHLQRIFKFAYGVPLGKYIRSRRLSESVSSLLNTDLNILNIALTFGFEYEQSYIRAFKQEFGITPAKLRNTGQILAVTPPLAHCNLKELTNGILFAPEIIMMPELQLIGKRHKSLYDSSFELPANIAKSFWFNERNLIQNEVNSSTYYGLTKIPIENENYNYYIPSLQVENSNIIPNGLECNIFPASLCIRFRYIGKHHYYDINSDIAKDMYRAIDSCKNMYGNYHFYHNNMFLEIIDTLAYDGTYCQMEWITPIISKDDRKC